MTDASSQKKLSKCDSNAFENQTRTSTAEVMRVHMCVDVRSRLNDCQSCRKYGRAHRAQRGEVKNTTGCATQQLSGSCNCSNNNCNCSSNCSSLSRAFNHAININDNLLAVRWLLRPRGAYFICLVMAKYIKSISWRIQREYFSPDIAADFPAGHQCVINVTPSLTLSISLFLSLSHSHTLD